jgi:hypothetical protein
MNHKKVLFLVLLLTLSSLVFAQGFYAKGFKAGLNLATYSGDNAGSNLNRKVGFAFGGFAQYGINRHFDLQPEFLLTMKGSSSESSEDDIKATNTLTYIEFPVLLKMYLDRTEDMSPNIFIGPAFGFNIGAKYNYEIGSEEGSGNLENINPVEFSMVFGGGFDTRTVTFDVRYEMGLSSIVEPEFDAELYNSVISFMLGIKLR